MNHDRLLQAYNAEIMDGIARGVEPSEFAIAHADRSLVRQYLATRRAGGPSAQFSAEDVMAGINRLRRTRGEAVEPGKIELTIRNGAGGPPLRLKCFAEPTVSR